MRNSKNPEVLISLITKKKLDNRDFLSHFFGILSSSSYRLKPEFADNTGERLTRRYIGLEESMPVFSATMTLIFEDITTSGPIPSYWLKKSAPKSRGSIHPTRTNLKGKLLPGWISIRSDPKCCPDWQELFEDLIRTSDAYYGTLHLFTPIELDRGRYTNESRENSGLNDYEYGLPALALEEDGLANLSWANYFGEGLSHLVNQTAILAAGYGVKQVNGYPLVTLTPDFTDVQRDIRGFFAKRAQLKKLFKPGTFRIEEEPMIYPTDP